MKQESNQQGPSVETGMGPHSPLPWATNWDDPSQLIDYNGNAIADCVKAWAGRETDEANAALIKRAVNQHAALLAEREATQMEWQACMGLLEDVPGECLGDRVHKMVVDYIAIWKALTDLRAFATAELRNTSLLMSNPPQSAAAWDIRNEIDRVTAALNHTPQLTSGHRQGVAK